MRSIKTIVMILIGPLLAGLILAGLVNMALSGTMTSAISSAHAANSPPQMEVAGVDAPEAAPAIRPSLRISIPYGFAPNFPLRANGEEVLVKGHGSCSDGETFTVAVTVTHAATGAIARGNVAGTCIGEATLQEWQLTATAESDPLSLGAAESCGLVQTTDGESVTDEQKWCVDVNLGDYLFLPIVTNEE